MKKLIIKDNKCGIYVIREIANGRIVYVGKDSNLDKNKRYQNHLITKKRFDVDYALQNDPDNFVYQQLLFCDKSDLDLLENVLIVAYKPLYNYHQLEKEQAHREESIIFIKKLINDYQMSVYEKQQLSLIIGLYAS